MRILARAIARLGCSVGSIDVGIACRSLVSDAQSSSSRASGACPRAFHSCVMIAVSQDASSSTILFQIEASFHGGRSAVQLGVGSAQLRGPPGSRVLGDRCDPVRGTPGTGSSKVGWFEITSDRRPERAPTRQENTSR